MRSTSLGARLVYQKLFLSTSADTKSKDSRNKCVSNSAYGSLGGSYKIVSVSTSFKYDSTKCSDSSSSNAYFNENRMSSTSVISIGSLPINNLEKWASSVKESPVPIQYVLDKISNMFISDWFHKISITDYENNSKKMNGTAMHKFFEDMSASYCKIILGKDCPGEEKGCGINSLCKPGTTCVEDPRSKLGYRCTACVPNKCGYMRCVEDPGSKLGYYCKGCSTDRCGSGMTCVSDSNKFGYRCKGCGSNDNKCGSGKFCTNDSNLYSGYRCNKKRSYGEVFIAGGWTDNSRYRYVQEVFGSRWLRSLPKSNDGLSLSLVNNRNLFSCGGRTKKGKPRTCYKLDINARRPRWKSIRNSIPGSVHYHTASTIGSHVWLVYYNSLYDLNTISESFRTYTTPFNAYTGSCSVSNNTYSYVIGVGSSRNEIWVNSRNSDPSKWHRVAKMARGRSNHACSWLDNNVYITGGSGNENIVEVFDTVSKRVWKTGTLNVGRKFHHMFILNGKPAVVGGTIRSYRGKNIKTDTVETYNVATGQWSRYSRKMRQGLDSFGIAQKNW